MCQLSSIQHKTISHRLYSLDIGPIIGWQHRRGKEKGKDTKDTNYQDRKKTGGSVKYVCLQEYLEKKERKKN